MRLVCGVVPASLLGSTARLAEFPAYSGRVVGGPVPADCPVGLVQMPESALFDQKVWWWTPRQQGYLVMAENLSAREMKNHLRTLRQIRDEHGCNRLWPWFDPRYMRLALTGLHNTDLIKLFGPLRSFIFIADEGLEVYSLQAGALSVLRVPT